MDKNGYLPRYMKYLFRSTTRNLGFTLKDFINYQDDATGTKRTNALLRIIITNMLFAEYKDHSLVAYFIGINPQKLRQWQNKYYKKTGDPLLLILEKQINTRNGVPKILIKNP